MSHVTRTKTDEAPCHFLRLPAELRIMIYELAQPEMRLCYYNPWQNLFSEREQFSQPSITRVNKQIRSESLSIFYGTNTFTLACTAANRELYSPWSYPPWRELRSHNNWQLEEYRWGWITSNRDHLHKIRHIRVNNLDYPWIERYVPGMAYTCEWPPRDPSGMWDLDIQMVKPETKVALASPPWCQTTLVEDSLKGQALEECLYKLLREAVEGVNPSGLVERPGTWFWLALHVVSVLYKSLHLSNLKMIISIGASGPYNELYW
ncbi:hypothetical protein MBLNU457_6383t1 [Dothideomycetes sp. NU457]